MSQECSNTEGFIPQLGIIYIEFYNLCPNFHFGNWDTPRGQQTKKVQKTRDLLSLVLKCSSTLPKMSEIELATEESNNVQNTTQRKAKICIHRTRRVLCRIHLIHSFYWPSLEYNEQPAEKEYKQKHESLSTEDRLLFLLTLNYSLIFSVHFLLLPKVKQGINHRPL